MNILSMGLSGKFNYFKILIAEVSISLDQSDGPYKFRDTMRYYYLRI